MSRVRTRFSFVDLLCLLPNEWKTLPKGVTKMILSKEFRHHLQQHQTTEGLVICIDDVTAESQGHGSSVWFRKHSGDEVEPDSEKYYPLKIRVVEAVEMSQI